MSGTLALSSGTLSLSIRSTLLALASALPSLHGAPAPPATAAAPEPLALELRETAGIRRYGYPVSATTRVTRDLERSRWTLRDERGPVQAQITTEPEPDGKAVRLTVDFETNLLPFEARRYVLEPRPAGGPEEDASRPSGGMRVEEDESSFRLSNGGTLDWTIPKRSLKLLESVKTPEKEFLRASGSGLKLRLKDGTLHEVSGPLSARILKRGPIAASVRLEWSEEVSSGSPIRGAVDLEVPRAKSWVRAQISIQDPRRVVAGLEVALDLVVGNEPLLVDLGTPGGVYASLQRGQAVRLAAKPDALKPWEALKGEVGKLEPYVTARRGAGPAEGWAHFMDAKRCTALAIADFAVRTSDRIEVDAAGGFRVSRTFLDDPSAPEATRDFTLWLHFVDTPPHVGAVTSPPSMLFPPETRWGG